MVGRFVLERDADGVRVFGAFATHPKIIAAIKANPQLGEAVVEGDTLHVHVTTSEGFLTLSTVLDETANREHLGAPVILFVEE